MALFKTPKPGSRAEASNKVVSASINKLTLGLVGKKDTIVSTAKNPTINKATSFIANNPGKAALALTGIVAPKATLTVAKNQAKKAATSFSNAKFGTQALVVGSSLVGAGILSTSSKARNAFVNTPQNLVSAGQAAGPIIDDPSAGNLKDFAKDYPGVTGAALFAGLYGAGTVVLGLANNLLRRDIAEKVVLPTEPGTPLPVAPPVAPPQGPPDPEKPKKKDPEPKPEKPEVTGPTFSPAPAAAPVAAAATVPKEKASVRNSIRQNNYYAISNNTKIEKYKYQRRHRQGHGDAQ